MKQEQKSKIRDLVFQRFGMPHKEYRVTFTGVLNTALGRMNEFGQRVSLLEVKN